MNFRPGDEETKELVEMAERTKIRVGDIVTVENWDRYRVGLVLRISPSYRCEMVYHVAMIGDKTVIMEVFYLNGDCTMPQRDISNLTPVGHVDLSQIALMTGYYDAMREERSKICSKRNKYARMMDEQISVLNDVIRGEEY